MSYNPFSAVFKDIKPDRNLIKAFYPYQGPLSEEQEAKLRPETELISKRIKDANANGLRKIRLGPHEKPNNQTMDRLGQYCAITTIYAGNNPHTDEPAFVGWDIVW